MLLKESIRCQWCLKDELYMNYHDNEWGIPSRDDVHLFEMLLLEFNQAGLSWYTILAKRENFRKAFDGFDVHKIANYGEEKVESLLKNEGIIRNRLKVNAAISNAKAFIEVQKEFGSFSTYLWSFTKGKVIKNDIQQMKDVLATSKESDEMSKALKKRGFKFMGSKVCYAYMQAIGMVNDHLASCEFRNATK